MNAIQAAHLMQGAQKRKHYLHVMSGVAYQVEEDNHVIPRAIEQLMKALWHAGWKWLWPWVESLQMNWIEIPQGRMSFTITRSGDGGWR